MNEIGFNISNDFKGIERVLQGLQSDVIEKAKVRALNRTAEKVKEHTVKEVLPSHIDGPTRWTLNAVMVRNASRKGGMKARVLFKDDRHVRRAGSSAARYLNAMIQGGSRAPKGFEEKLKSLNVIGRGQFAVPGADARLDRNGNIPAAQYREMMADLGAAGKNRSASVKYFVVPSYPSKPIGIYRRMGSGKKLRQIVCFVDSLPDYDERLPFYKEADKMAARLISEEFREAAQYYANRFAK